MKRFHETKEYSFAGLVSSYKKFLIPNFQRSYKWKNKQITDFFSSVEQNPSSYFIGNIVCVLGQKNQEERLLIVDGQQRITTISLLLIALRDHAQDLLSDSAEEVDWINEYLKDRDKKERKDYFILKARKKSYNDVLEDLINRTVSTNYDKAQRAYINAYKILRKLVDDKIGTSNTKFKDFTDKTLDLEVVAIVLNSDKEVFNAFEGLNSKGLGLSTSDQVKNFLFSHAEKLACLDEIELKWNEIESDFEKTNPDLITKFLRHLWISENKYISGGDLYDAIKLEINSKKSKQALLKYVEKISTYSKFYLGVKYESLSHYLNHIDESARSVLQKFKHLDNQQVFEILLALYKKSNEDLSFKPKYFRDVATVLWNFCFRTRFLIINPSKYEREFAQYCQLITTSKSQNLINESKTFFTLLRRLTNDKATFVSTMAEDLSYESDAVLIKFLLKEIIEKADKGVVTFTEASIEHILPQEPKEWGFSKKDVKDVVHNIGNLTILHPKDNQKAKNKNMKKKCEEIFEKSHFKFNKEISLKYQDLFTDDFSEAIRQRGEDISSQIYQMTKI